MSGSFSAWPDHLLSLDDWRNLPEDNARSVELVEGVLLVAPRPGTFHQRAASRLAVALDTALPPHLTALAEVEVVLEGLDSSGPATVRIPDLVVVPTAVAETNPARYRADEVVVAVEVQSPGTTRTDRVTKFSEYAEAGIMGYWLVDLDAPVAVTAYALRQGGYERLAESHDRLDVNEPVQVSIQVSGLVSR